MEGGAALDLIYSKLEEFTVLQPVPSNAEICGDTCTCCLFAHIVFFFAFANQVQWYVVICR